MPSKIVVFGATGYAGGLAVEALRRRGLRPVLAGTREDALRDLSRRLDGLDYQRANATDLDSVRSLVGPGDVLVTTVGPFERIGFTAAQAAADRGAHYVDSTGEVAFVRSLQERHHARARETGAVMLPAFGNDYVPGILAGTLAAKQAGDAARSLDVGYFVDGSLRGGKGLSQGTRKTVMEGLTRPVTVWADRRLRDERAAHEVRTFTIDGRKREDSINPSRRDRSDGGNSTRCSRWKRDRSTPVATRIAAIGPLLQIGCVCQQETHDVASFVRRSTLPEERPTEPLAPLCGP